MPTEIHRGRLIDHIQLVVRDIEASRAFYTAVFETLQVPMDKGAEDHFFADELFISTADSEAAPSKPSTTDPRSAVRSRRSSRSEGRLPSA